ncbi:hypothetical protein [Mycobacterium sp. IS-3022]|uniref:hypothetical protein n=1 Tax=Mycobacterium sp. IS-3022 TaxID=1772277 RepID=UPI0012E38182|nr:hypothetical protein [Mycobacterium sp. IS-3022]
MPRRRRTRAQDRLQRIEHERALNTLDRSQRATPVAAEPSRPPPDDPWNIDHDVGTDDLDADPPPF